RWLRTPERKSSGQEQQARQKVFLNSSYSPLNDWIILFGKNLPGSEFDGLYDKAKDELIPNWGYSISI
ncbi:MAG: hypothetical protein QX198_09660, partial [Methylococcaceae bacterium]